MLCACISNWKMTGAVMDQVCQGGVHEVVDSFLVLVPIVKPLDVVAIRVVSVALRQVHFLVVVNDVLETGPKPSVIIVTCQANDYQNNAYPDSSYDNSTHENAAVHS